MSDEKKWVCPTCGNEQNAGNFCSQCGQKKESESLEKTEQPLPKNQTAETEKTEAVVTMASIDPRANDSIEDSARPSGEQPTIEATEKTIPEDLAEPITPSTPEASPTEMPQTSPLTAQSAPITPQTSQVPPQAAPPSYSWQPSAPGNSAHTPYMQNNGYSAPQGNTVPPQNNGWNPYPPQNVPMYTPPVYANTAQPINAYYEPYESRKARNARFLRNDVHQAAKRTAMSIPVLLLAIFLTIQWCLSLYDTVTQIMVASIFTTPISALLNGLVQLTMLGLCAGGMWAIFSSGVSRRPMQTTGLTCIKASVIINMVIFWIYIAIIFLAYLLIAVGGSFFSYTFGGSGGETLLVFMIVPLTILAIVITIAMLYYTAALGSINSAKMAITDCYPRIKGLSRFGVFMILSAFFQAIPLVIQFAFPTWIYDSWDTLYGLSSELDIPVEIWSTFYDSFFNFASDPIRIIMPIVTLIITILAAVVAFLLRSRLHQHIDD